MKLWRHDYEQDLGSDFMIGMSQQAFRKGTCQTGKHIPASSFYMLSSFHRLIYTTFNDFRLLHFLPLPLLLHRRTIQPHRHKRRPPRHCPPNAHDPHPRPTDRPTPRPLIVRKVAYRDRVLLVHVRHEGPLVVDAEVEDAVLVRDAEGCREEGAVGCVAYGEGAGGGEGEAVVGVQHGEFELDGVGGGWAEGVQVVPGVLGELDRVRLWWYISELSCNLLRNRATYHVILDPIHLRVDVGSGESHGCVVGRRGIAIVAVQMMHDPAHLQNTQLLKRPARELLGKLPVCSRDSRTLALDIISRWAYIGTKPGILQHLHRPEDGEAGRVTRLHSRDQGELLARRERVFDCLGFLLGVVAVCRCGCLQDWREQRTCVAEDLADCTRDG